MALTTCKFCGTAYDYASLPAYNAKAQRPGKYCPDCGAPADEETATRDGAHRGTFNILQGKAPIPDGANVPGYKAPAKG